jgi:hypothetical protein
MNYTHNYAPNSIQYDTNKKLKNKGFLIIDSIFKENKWDLIHNEMNHISYSKFGYETTCFDIKIFTNKIVVSIPIKHSIYQYVTSFKNCYDASEYLEQRFRDYIL